MSFNYRVVYNLRSGASDLSIAGDLFDNVMDRGFAAAQTPKSFTLTGSATKNFTFFTPLNDPSLSAINDTSFGWSLLLNVTTSNTNIKITNVQVDVITSANVLVATLLNIATTVSLGAGLKSFILGIITAATGLAPTDRLRLIITVHNSKTSSQSAAIGFDDRTTKLFTSIPDLVPLIID